MHAKIWWVNLKERDLFGSRDNIKLHFKEMGWGFVDWIDLIRNGDKPKAILKAVMNLRVP
jgi:hypothetical protein